MEQVAAADREIHLKLAEKGGPSTWAFGTASFRCAFGNSPCNACGYVVAHAEAEDPCGKASCQRWNGQDTDNDPEKKKVKKPPILNDKRISKMPMAARLRGGTPVDNEGKAICFGCNFNTCHEKQCKKGRRVCCSPGCFNPGHTVIPFSLMGKPSD